jgi:hypothetical protein
MNIELMRNCSLDPDGGILGRTGELRPRHPGDPYTVVDIPLLYMLKTLFTYPKPPTRSSLDSSAAIATAATAATDDPAVPTTGEATGEGSTAFPASTITDLQLRALAGLHPGILDAAARQANLPSADTEQEDGRTEYRRMPGGYVRPSP